MISYQGLVRTFPNAAIPDASIKDIEVLTTLFFNADFINVPLLIVLNSKVILRREISECK
ncbi:hypothetical protein, partial [Escherichia coli]|uniref:hypothetical protein n=1 Tax=Escherichia coli TaxID=562 RepID=UPI001BDBAF08